MAERDFLTRWMNRYPPEGQWVFYPGVTSGRFAWRGLMPVLCGQFGDRPLRRVPETSRQSLCTRRWHPPVTTSRPWLFVGETVAVELDCWRSSLAFQLHPIVPGAKGDGLYTWGSARVGETGLPIRPFDFEPAGFRHPVHHQFGSLVARGLVGLAEHHPEAFEQALTAPDWDAVTPLLRRGMAAQRRALREQMTVQAHADFLLYPELRQLPATDAFELLSDRYFELDELVVAEIVQDGARSRHRSVREAQEREVARLILEDAAQARRTQAQQRQEEQRRQEARRLKPGEDEFGPFVEFCGAKFDRADLEAYLRQARTTTDVWSAGRYVLGLQQTRGKEASGRPGLLRTVFVQLADNDYREVMRLFWPDPITVQEHLALLNLRKARRRAARQAARTRRTDPG